MDTAMKYSVIAGTGSFLPERVVSNDALAAELAHSIEQRLASELPSLVEATLAGLQDDLKAGIIAATEAALKDFIARRQQLQLPFDPPAPGN